MGELLEIMGQNQRALNAYKKGKCFSKIKKIIKSCNLSDIKIKKSVEEELNKNMLEQNIIRNSSNNNKDMDNESPEKLIEDAIKKNEWEKAVELVNKYPNVNPSFFIEIGNHFKNESKLDKAEEFFIKGGKPTMACNMYININKFMKKEKLNQIIEQRLEKYKQFFEEMENKINSFSQNKKQFTEEEQNEIKQKLIEL